MKRALLWFGVMLLIPVLALLFVGGLPQTDADHFLMVFAAVASFIWICVGVAWGARGVVRYLKR